MNKKTAAESIEEFKNNIVSNIPGLIAFAITDLDTGIALISHTNDKDFDPELASSFNLEVVKSKMKAVEALNLNEKIIDISINLGGQIHIIDIADNGEYFIYLAVDSSQSNLGMTKSLLKTYKKGLLT